MRNEAGRVEDAGEEWKHTSGLCEVEEERDQDHGDALAAAADRVSVMHLCF